MCSPKLKINKNQESSQESTQKSRISYGAIALCGSIMFIEAALGFIAYNSAHKETQETLIKYNTLKQEIQDSLPQSVTPILNLQALNAINDQLAAINQKLDNIQVPQEDASPNQEDQSTDCNSEDSSDEENVQEEQFPQNEPDCLVVNGVYVGACSAFH